MICKLVFTFLSTALLVACSGKIPTTEPPAGSTKPPMVEPTQQPVPRLINNVYRPQADDNSLKRGNVFIDKSELFVMESDPVQIALILKGALPTPCNHLRVVATPPDEQNRIQVDVYSVIDPTQICAQVLESLDANVGLGSFPAGHYSVWVNGEKIGELYHLNS
jgi:hypothetical protein